ncbi:MAG: SDR family oxidoreductase [Anaerolineae bacterium]
MKVLIAGSTGYLGRFVVREFKRRGYWIRALARNPGRLAEPGPFLAPAVRDQIDDLFVGQVTRPETLAGLCDGIDVVFSSVGLTRQKDGLTFHDVDYQGNRNILDRALEASVTKFLYVSVYNAHLMEHLAIVKAHEEFVRALQASGLPHTILRPTGYFSDIGEYFQMAQTGRAYLIGDGKNRLNPIHGADLANVCAEALTGGDAEVPAGGPVIYSQNEIAELAFSVLGKPPRITHIPAGLARVGIGAMRLFDRHAADLFDFFATAGRYENVAPCFGTHALDAYFRELSRSPAEG